MNRAQSIFILVKQRLENSRWNARRTLPGKVAGKTVELQLQTTTGPMPRWLQRRASRVGEPGRVTWPNGIESHGRKSEKGRVPRILAQLPAH